MLLSVPTCWAVIKAINRIRTHVRPSPLERDEENFYTEGKNLKEGKSERRRKRSARRREHESSRSDADSAEEGDSLRGKKGSAAR